jgi:hypothetical protein
MTRIIPLIPLFYLLITSSTAWPQEPTRPLENTQNEGAQPDQPPFDKSVQKKPEDQAPPQSSTQPAGPQQAPATQPTPEGTSQVKPEEKAPPSQGSTLPASPAQPQETPPATEGTPPVKPEATAPDQGSAQPTGPAQPQGTPPATEAKPQEKGAEKVLQSTEEEKKKSLSTAIEQATNVIKGRLELELTETYTNLSSNQLFIEGFGVLPILIVGEAQVQRVRRDSFTTTLATRYKITEDVQAELRVPYQITIIRVSTAVGILGRATATPDVENVSKGSGLGDVSGSLSYHLLNEGLERPSSYVGLGFKGRTGRDAFETADALHNPPTGSGFNSVNLSLNAAKTSDPAVVFASLSYAYPISRHNVVLHRPNNQRPLLIDLYPGNGIGFNVGWAYALNYKLTLSLGFQESVNSSTHIKGEIKLPHHRLVNSATNAASIRFGVVWRLTDKTVIDLSVSPGLTLDAPDLQLALRIPYRF